VIHVSTVPWGRSCRPLWLQGTWKTWNPESRNRTGTRHIKIGDVLRRLEFKLESIYIWNSISWFYDFQWLYILLCFIKSCGSVMYKFS